jgi:hypothetical protein
MPTQEQMNPWHPIDNKVDLKHLGKLSEELGECNAAVARCIIQGVESREPMTGKFNKTWLEEEIADVEANIQLVKERFNLDRTFIADRAETKVMRLKSWHRMA